MGQISTQRINKQVENRNSKEAEGMVETYPTWAPRPGEWKPGMKWAAMDSDGAVFQYQYRPKAIHKRWSAGSGKSFAYAMSKPLEAWTQAFVRRPESDERY